MKVILLLGASTSGKTSLCNELKEKFQWKIIAFDEIAKKLRKPEYIEMYKKLSLFMTDKEIFQICQKHVLTISNGKKSINNYQFIDNTLIDLENILNDLDFENITSIANDIRSIVLTYIPHEKICEELFQTLFNELNDNNSIVLDVPPNKFGDTNMLIGLFQQYCNKFKTTNSNLESFTALLYCSPVILSERISKRNSDAIITNNPLELRKGLFPFEQYASLVSVYGDDIENTQLGSFSRNELKEIINKHSLIGSTDNNQEKVIVEFKDLKNKFGFFKHQKNGILSVSKGLNFDIVLNSENDSPSLLAEKLISQVTNTYYKSGLG